MFLAPPRPEVELGTVSFKSKMDEVIKNFCQYWPIYDLPFDVVNDEEENEVKDCVGDRNGVPKMKTLVEALKREHCDISRSLCVDSRGLDEFDDDVDGCTESLTPPRKISVQEKKVKKPDEVCIALEDKVDIAICLPTWPE